MDHRRRAVITGMGVVAPHSPSVDGLFEALCRGESAVDHIRNFDPIDHPTRIAAEVRYGVEVPAKVGPYRIHNRSLQFVVHAGRAALAQAGLTEDDGGDPSLRAVYLATGIGSASLKLFGPPSLRVWGDEADSYASDLSAFYQELASSPEALEFDEYYLDTAAPALGVMLGAGQVYNTASACASGSHVLADALQMIRRGEAEVLVVGGAGSPVTRTMIPGFAMLQALSRRNDDPKAASRPFDAERDGFVMGEGAGILVVESLDHARRRGATIQGEILGAGIATDSYRLTDPHPEGEGMASAMGRALKDAGIAPDRVDYINAHGTSTPMNDASETRAIKQVFGEAAYRIPISSSKSMFGHLIHAAGSTEAIVCLKSIQTGRIHPTVNLTCPDPLCDLDYVPEGERLRDVRIAVNNSFGFGGQNVSLVLGRYEE